MKQTILLFIFSLSLWGQSQTKVAPDCSLTFNFTVAGNSSNFDNRTISASTGVPCRYWTLSYYSQGFSGLSLTVQDAPDVAGAPGVFVTFAGTVVTGINPNTSTTSSTTDFNGYFPWMRVNLSSLTGSGQLHGTLNGWRTNAGTISSSGSSGCPGTSGSPCDVQGVTAAGSAATENPLLDGARDASGNKVALTLGTTSAAVSLTSSGLTQIVALSGVTLIRITHISVSFASSVDFQLEYGTGANCAAGTTALTGVYKSILTVALDFDLDPLIVPSAQALCVNLGASVVGGGLVKFAQF